MALIVSTRITRLSRKGKILQIFCISLYSDEGTEYTINFFKE